MGEQGLCRHRSDRFAEPLPFAVVTLTMHLFLSYGRSMALPASSWPAQNNSLREACRSESGRPRGSSTLTCTVCPQGTGKLLRPGEAPLPSARG
jgi:hypothetical protein